MSPSSLPTSVPAVAIVSKATKSKASPAKLPKAKKAKTAGYEEELVDEETGVVTKLKKTDSNRGIVEQG